VRGTATATTFPVGTIYGRAEKQRFSTLSFSVQQFSKFPLFCGLLPLTWRCHAYAGQLIPQTDCEFEKSEELTQVASRARHCKKYDTPFCRHPVVS